MKKIKAEGANFYYFLKSDLPPTDDFLGGKLFGKLSSMFDVMCQQLGEYNNYRLTVFEIKPPVEGKDTVDGFVFFLYWLDEPDLDQLDSKVTLGTHEDSDFASAVKTSAVLVKCFECDWQGRSLRFGDAEIYDDAPGLHDIKYELAMSNLLPCPNCGKPLRIPIVKIFDE